MELQVIDPIMGLKEVLKNAGVEATARHLHTLKSVVELAEITTTEKTITFPLSNIGTPFSIENRLAEGCIFSAATHSISVAKVKVDAAGAPIWGSAVWYMIPFESGAPFDNSPSANDLNESEQLLQLWQGELAYYAENLPINEMIDTIKLKDNGANIPKYFHINGKYETNKAILTLNADVITDLLGGIAADAGQTKNYVCLEVDGWLSKDYCNPDAVNATLFQKPKSCGHSGDCQCPDNTTGVIHPFGLVD